MVVSGRLSRDQATSLQPPAKAEEQIPRPPRRARMTKPRAKGEKRVQLLCFQEFAYKSHRFKNLQRKVNYSEENEEFAKHFFRE